MVAGQVSKLCANRNLIASYSNVIILFLEKKKLHLSVTYSRPRFVRGVRQRKISGLLEAHLRRHAQHEGTGRYYTGELLRRWEGRDEHGEALPGIVKGYFINRGDEIRRNNTGGSMNDFLGSRILAEDPCTNQHVL